MSTEALDRLESFVRAVDTVNEDVEQKIKDVVAGYIRSNSDEESSIHYEVLVAETTRDRDGPVSRRLVPHWKSYAASDPIPLAQSRHYEGHAEYCFSEEKDIWIHAPNADNRLLKNAEPSNFVDAYGNEDLPTYRAYEEENSRTSIVKTIKDEREKDTIGLLTIESSEVLECNRVAKSALEKIARIISIVIRTRRDSKLNVENTVAAAKSLEAGVSKAPHFKSVCRKPYVFVAHSASAEPDVLQIMNLAIEQASKQVYEENDLHIEPKYWTDDRDPDDILSRVVRDMRRSTAGVCYVSQPAVGNGYEDNPNVLYEAGIMFGFEQLTQQFRGWLLIRETDSPPVPFDLAQKNTVIVERDDYKKICNKKTVESGIREALEKVLVGS